MAKKKISFVEACLSLNGKSYINETIVPIENDNIRIDSEGISSVFLSELLPICTRYKKLFTISGKHSCLQCGEICLKTFDSVYLKK